MYLLQISAFHISPQILLTITWTAILHKFNFVISSISFLISFTMKSVGGLYYAKNLSSINKNYDLTGFR
jgi:hypothetical protein